jgi:23S rRNA (cytidine2498-2'-O)-methyltransferase
VNAYLSTAGFEEALVDELARDGRRRARAIAAGVVIDDDARPPIDPVFARQVLPAARFIEGASVRALAEAAFAAVEAAVDGWTGPFSLHALAGAEPAPGLASRVELVGRETLTLFGERRRRASRRYRPPDEAPAVDDPGRLLVQLLAVERDRLLVSAATPHRLAFGGLDLAPWPAGDAPVAIDRSHPSRAYQKLEEAFAWMGAAPGPGELCVDLGAAPGGWTSVAIRRGARVVAVDRASLAPPLARHARVAMVVGNAFTYQPTTTPDWLLSDVICEPARSIALVARWLEPGLCRNLVVTVKFKGRAGYRVLAELPPLFARFAPAFARVKQLSHNKNEVTVMVRCRP